MDKIYDWAIKQEEIEEINNKLIFRKESEG